MKLLDTAEIKDVQSFISGGNTLNVRVNFYQRPYRWTARKVTDLFEDYKENRVYSAGNNFEYFLGAVVFVDERNEVEKSSGKTWKYQVVDGQQRFTTLFLFNFIKYMLLIRKVDEAARINSSTDFIEGLQAIEDCYAGFIGSNNVSVIRAANSALRGAFDTANRNRIPIDNNDLNQWRDQVGWIVNPDISLPTYYDDCKTAMRTFLQNETMSIYYENNNFNQGLKDALSDIVIKFSDASDAALCEDPIDDYDESDDTRVEFPYVDRAYGIFDQVKRFYGELNPNTQSSYDKLSGYIKIIDEMLQNIKLCMIVTSNEDDAYKLFETLNDRSEAVNDLELLKDYFFKTYTETSGDSQAQINANIAALDDRWRTVFFSYEDLEPEIFEYMTVFFTGDTNKNTNERKRKLIKGYLAKYTRTGARYTSDVIKRDFEYMEFIREILLKIHRMDNTNHCKSKREDPQLSLYIENDPSASVVKRALGLAMNVPYPVVVGSVICDIIHNYESNARSNSVSFSQYIQDVFSENACKQLYPGLWKDAALLWKVAILSKNYVSPKLFSDKLAQRCNVDQISNSRVVSNQLIMFDPNEYDESDLKNEFDEWINEWKFQDGYGKIKIKNLFMHMFLRYDRDAQTDELVLNQHILRTYANDAIVQDLDHMDAKTVNRQGGNEVKYFHYDLSDRTDFTNSLGNMIPLPVAINRGKHNTPMFETIQSFPTDNLVGWIFDLATDEFNANNTVINGFSIPTEAFFTTRKDRLVAYFKRIAENQKFTPAPRV